MIKSCVSLCGVLMMVGCVSQGNVRTPEILQGQLASEHAAVQRRNFEIHDPLPSEDIGPFTDTRPREYRIQRAEPRRAVENYYDPRLQTMPSGAVPRSTSPTAEFSGTVDPG